LEKAGGWGLQQYFDNQSVRKVTFARGENQGRVTLLILIRGARGVVTNVC